MVGSAVGSFIAKDLMAYGRKRAILISNAIVIVAGMLTIIESIPCIVIGRLFQGLCGASMTVLAKLIQETAPIQVRAQLGTLSNTMMSIGLILAFSLGLGLPDTEEEKQTTNYWRFLFLVPILIASLQSLAILAFFNHETPMYLLLNKNDEVSAKRALRKIYYEEDIDNVVTYIRETNQT